MTCFRTNKGESVKSMLGNSIYYQRFYNLVEQGYSIERAIKDCKLEPCNSFVKQTLKLNFCNVSLAVEKKIKARNKRTKETMAESIAWARRRGIC